MMCEWLRNVAAGGLFTASVVLSACGGGPPPPASSTTEPAKAATPEQRYDLKGTVVSLDKTGKSVTVNHDEIKGFMSAMTMAYSVKDPKALDAVAKGDVVTAKLVSTGESYWLEDVQVVEHAKQN
jgi:protein SCO1/2